MITQQKWRIVGVLALVACLAMVLLGRGMVRPGVSVWLLLGYWGVFTVLLLVALYVAFLDIRYTRLQYKISERSLFRETFMTPEFRKAMQEALEAQKNTPPTNREQEDKRD